MAQIDTSMYSQSTTPDFVGDMSQGMKLKEMANQQKQQQKTKDLQTAVAKSYDTDANGNLVFNPSKLSALATGDNASVDPAMAAQYVQQQNAAKQSAQESHLEFMGKQVDLANKMLGGVTDENSYNAIRPKLIQNGLFSADELPEEYDEDNIKAHQLAGLSAKDRLDSQMKQQGLSIQQQEADAKTKTAQDTHDDRLQKMDTTQSTKSDDAYQKAMKDMNSFRGNTAVQQAASAVTNAKNAMNLADKGNLSTSDLHLFASEMGKLATNGVPGQSEIDALVPNTAKTQLANVTQFFANSPSDADAQDFINHNKPYLKDLLNNYGGVVDTYKNNIVDGYKKKLDPDDYAELKGRIKSQSAVTNEASATPVPPKPGDVQEGHVYLGGDPANPQSWKAQ